jgi:hypothetical protein
MRRLILGLIVAGAVSAGTFGSAASFGGFGSAQLGAQAANLGPCDDTGINATYDIVYGNNIHGPGYYVDSVEVSDVDVDCNGGNIRITLTDAAGSPVGTEVNTFLTVPSACSAPGGGDECTYSFSVGQVLAETVTDNNVAISGGNPAGTTP